MNLRLPPELQPKLIAVLREGYSAKAFGRDALAGVVVGVVALPLAIAFAIASGVRPEQGLFTAVIAGFLISALGGSRVQIGGPTGAFVVIVAGIVARHGVDGLAVATILAGLILIAMALARFGDVIRFIPYPVIVGFTTGIALIIAAGQVGDALGLRIDHVPPHIWEKWTVYSAHLSEIRGEAIALCVLTIAIILLWPRVTTKVPGSLVALVVTAVLARVIGLEVETIGSRFGEIPSRLPAPQLPAVDWNMIRDLMSPAIAIALLAAIESLLSAMVADGMIGGRHRSNAELLGQGVANVVTPLFGGIPATGAIARTATNVKSGGRTPIAGIVHAITLLAILMIAGRWAALIPMATLAGILLVIAYHMSDWRMFARLLRSPRSDVLVLLTTFVLTVAVDLTVAIQAGVVLAAILFMRRMAEVTQIKPIQDALHYEEGGAGEAGPGRLPPGIEAFEINGTFCFGAAHTFAETLATTRSRPRVVILQMRHVLAMDATGLRALEDIAARLRHKGSTLLLAGVHAQPLVALERSGALERIGSENLLFDFESALKRGHELIARAGKPGAS